MFHDWITEQALGPLMALGWHFAILIVLIVLAVLWLVYGTLFKQIAMYILIGLVVALFTAMIYTKLGAHYEKAKCDAVNTVETGQATAARANAEAAFPAAVGDHAERLWSDPHDRDNTAAGLKNSGLARRLGGFQAHHLFKFKGHGGDGSPGSGS